MRQRVSEAVYNFKRHQNSPYSPGDRKILLEMEVAREVSVREVFEGENLAQLLLYIRNKSQETEVNREVIYSLHQMLIAASKMTSPVVLERSANM